MSSRLTPCPACARHVKEGDRVCPFCGDAVPFVSLAPARTAAGHLSRAALFAVGAMGAAVAATDCSSSSESAYGGPPVFVDAALGDDSGGGVDAPSSNPDDAAKKPVPIEGGSAQPVYGAPVAPAGSGHN